MLDDRNLIVTASGRRKYHVELSRSAFGLRSNWAIGLRSRTNTVCAGSSDLVVDDGFGRQEAVRLTSIRELSPEELDVLLVEYGKKDPKKEQTPEPEKEEGAEVEELD